MKNQPHRPNRSQSYREIGNACLGLIMRGTECSEVCSRIIRWGSNFQPPAAHTLMIYPKPRDFAQYMAKVLAIPRPPCSVMRRHTRSILTHRLALYCAHHCFGRLHMWQYSQSLILGQRRRLTTNSLIALFLCTEGEGFTRTSGLLGNLVGNSTRT
jgi:hypothetical protein